MRNRENDAEHFQHRKWWRIYRQMNRLQLLLQITFLAKWTFGTLMVLWPDGFNQCHSFCCERCFTLMLLVAACNRDGRMLNVFRWHVSPMCAVYAERANKQWNCIGGAIAFSTYVFVFRQIPHTSTIDIHPHCFICSLNDFEQLINIATHTRHEMINSMCE